MRKPTEKTTINNRDQAVSCPPKNGYNMRAVLNDRKGKHFCVWKRTLNDRSTRQECRRLLSSLSGLKIVGVEIVKRKRSFSKSVSFWILFTLSLDINHPQWALKQCSNMALGGISYSLGCLFIHSVAAI